MNIYWMTIHLPNGEVWQGDAYPFAAQRARVLAKADTERIGERPFLEVYREELELGLNDSYTLRDWVRGNLNWVDIEPLLVRVRAPDEKEYEELLRSSSIQFNEDK